MTTFLHLQLELGIFDQTIDVGYVFGVIPILISEQINLKSDEREGGVSRKI